jgi:hypothetical protein
MNTKSFRFNHIPVDFGDHLPDGDYTIGRGADPRGPQVKNQASSKTTAQPVKIKKSRTTSAPTPTLHRGRKIVTTRQKQVVG